MNILEHTKDGKEIRYNLFTILAIVLLTIDPLLGHTKKGTIGTHWEVIVRRIKIYALDKLYNYRSFPLTERCNFVSKNCHHFG